MKSLRKSLNNFLLKKNFYQLEEICTHSLLEKKDEEIYLEYRSLAYFYQKKLKQYLLDLEELLKIDKNNFHANLSLANYYFQKQNLQNAKKYIEKIIEVKKNIKVYELYIKILIASKDYQKAEKTINFAKNLFQKDLVFDFFQYELYEAQNQFLKSIKGLQDIEKKLPKNILIKSKIANIGLKIEDYDLAEDYFDKIIKLEDHNLEALINIVRIKKAKGNFNDAKLQIKNALSCYPQNPVLFTYEIDLLFEEIDENRIEQVLKSVEKLNENEKSIIYFAVSKYYDRKKEYKKFSQYLNKANVLKRSLFSKYDIYLHLKEQKKIREYQTRERFFKFYNKNYENIKKKEKDTVVPIFVVGMPRSGSTLVEQILSSHSQIEGFGEINFFRELFEEQFGNITYTHLIDLLAEKETSNLFKTMGENYINKVHQFKKTQKNFIIDKMLLNYQFLSLIKICLPQSKFIFCKRNKAENCFSIYKLDFQSFMPWSYCPIECKKMYDEHLIFLNHFKTFMSDDIYEIDYENLIVDFDKEVKKLVDFIGLEFEENCLDYDKNKRLVLTASNKQVRNKIYNTSLSTKKECRIYFPEFFS